MKLNEYLKAENIKAKTLADKAGITPNMITRFLKGERGMHPGTAAAVSAACDGKVSIEELLYPEGLPSEAKFASNDC
jgi:transcriptional regulator with XRE-family HTH domain